MEFFHYVATKSTLTAVITFLCIYTQYTHADSSAGLVCEEVCSNPSYVSYYSIEYEECLISCGNVINRLKLQGGIERANEELEEEEDSYYPDVLNTYPDKRQKSSFVRIGRTNSAFVRVGRSIEKSLERMNNDRDKRLSSFVRIGKGDPEYMPSNSDKRASSFVRIGKSDPEYMTPDTDKRVSSFVRIGRGNSIFKRPSSFVRIGKKSDYDEPPTKRVSSFVRIGKSLPQWGPFTQENKRLSSFVRIGKAAPSSFVRIGKAAPSSFVRIGKSGNNMNEPTNLEKRLSSFVRIGRNLNGDHHQNPKRMSSFVRIGKSSDGPLHPMFGVDRQYSIGETSPTDSIDKRFSSFVRIGKKNSDSLADSDSKRASSFVRIGKGYADEPIDKRVSSFVRIGKRSESSDKIFSELHDTDGEIEQ